MNANTSVERPNDKPDMDRAIVVRMAQVLIQFAITMVILFAASGRLTWVWAWAYLGAGIAVLIVNMCVLPRELIAERGQPRENVKRWDRVVTGLSILPTLALPIVAGLDERFGWSPQLALAIHLLGLVLMALGQGLFTWAMASNKFFSTAVRIQMDREHTVASSGPYCYVRHPGYVGYVVTSIAMSLLLGSLWALIPTGVVTCLLIVRTALEDRTLRQELKGYEAYAQRVRYRLLPGVW